MVCYYYTRNNKVDPNTIWVHGCTGQEPNHAAEIMLLTQLTWLVVFASFWGLVLIHDFQEKII